MVAAKLGEYLLRFHDGDTLETFLQREKFDVPVLVQLNGKATSMGSARSRFETLADSSGEFRAYAPFEQLVYRLEKEPGKNPFSFVALGRAPNNDIVLNHGHVSGVSALFMQDKGSWYVQNMANKGTLVNGQEIARDKKVELIDGSTLAIKRFEFAYHTPAGLYAAILEERVKYKK